MLVITGAALALFLIRFTGPSDLVDDYHQERAAAYVLDALRNGNWICQTGLYDECTSKPPMFTWIAAVSSLPFAHASWFALILPGAVATVAITYLLFAFGSRYFGPATGFFAAMLYLLSPLGAKQMALVRIDGLFSLTVTVTALVAFHSWRNGRNWTGFWLAAAVTTLTKGPLGILLGAGGLAAVYWERRQGQAAPLRGSHWAGILVFLAIVGGWFGAAYWQIGQPLIDKMLGRELVGQVVGKGSDAPLNEFYKPTLYFMRHFAPWCLLSFIALWRVWKRPARGDWERRFERFLVCWFLIGLVIFSIAAHQRPDLIFPIVPPAALLAGREVSQWLSRFQLRTAICIVTACVSVALGLAAVKYHVADAQKPRTVKTEGMKQLAKQVRAKAGDEFPLTYTESPCGLQFYLNMKRSLVSLSDAARLLRSESAAFVVVTNFARLQQEMGNQSRSLHDLLLWSSGRESVHIVSNHRQLEWAERMACLIKPVRLEMQGIQAMRTQGHKLTFTSSREKGWVKLSAFPADQRVQVQILEGAVPGPNQNILQNGESWTLEIAGSLTLRIKPLPTPRSLSSAGATNSSPR